MTDERLSIVKFQLGVEDEDVKKQNQAQQLADEIQKKMKKKLPDVKEEGKALGVAPVFCTAVYNGDNKLLAYNMSKTQAGLSGPLHDVSHLGIDKKDFLANANALVKSPGSAQEMIDAVKNKYPGKGVFQSNNLNNQQAIQQKPSVELKPTTEPVTPSVIKGRTAALLNVNQAIKPSPNTSKVSLGDEDALKKTNSLTPKPH